MPNAGAFAWRAMHALKANPFWAELEHYHNFSRKRLYALLESHAFTPASYGVSERYPDCAWRWSRQEPSAKGDEVDADNEQAAILRGVFIRGSPYRRGA